MKRILLLFLILPFIGFSQETLLDFPLQGNLNNTLSSYATISYGYLGVKAEALETTGVSAAGWNTLTKDTRKYYELSIKPNPGEMLYISSINAKHTAIGSGVTGNRPPTNYSIEYFKSTATGTVVTGASGLTSTTTGITNAITVDTYLNSGESLVIRFYAWGGGSSDNARWRIDANNFKINGYDRLCGNYLVGNIAPKPFKSLTTAAEAINNLGLDCAVNYLLTEANYTASSTNPETFPITLKQLKGSSTTNTLTVKPNLGTSTTISGNTNSAVFKFDGADNIIINGSFDSTNTQNLTIYNNNTSTTAERAVVWLNNTSSNNKFKNLIVKQNNITSGTLILGIAATGNSFSDRGNNPNNEIDNVNFTDVKQAVYINGFDGGNTNWVITNNIIGSTIDNNKPFLGIYLNNVNGYNVSNNIIDGVKLPLGVGYDPSHSAIYVVGAGSNSGVVSNNIISNIENATSNKTGYGIFTSGNNSNIINNNTITNLKTTSTSGNIAGIYSNGNNVRLYNNKVSIIEATQSILINGIHIKGDGVTVYNNMIANVASAGGGNPNSQSGNGIFIESGTNIKLYYNTVRLQNIQNTGASAALFINGGTQLDIRNNIFINAQASGSTRFAVYSVSSSPSIFTNIDYNDYVSSQHIGSFGSFYTASNIKTTLTQWRTATTKDVNSINVAPSFVSPTDLHLSASNASFDDKGININTFTSDIDNETRSTTNPDMGADEYIRCSATTVWNGTAWSNKAPTLSVKAVIDGNYNTLTNGNITACDLVVNAGKILTITENKTVEVQSDITTNGSLVIEDRGSLVQNDDNGKNTGAISITRKSTPMKQYDYTYWSSPVAGFQLKNFTNANVHYTFAPAKNNYEFQSGEVVMALGKGYLVRAPENGMAIQTVNATFTGVPYTGSITIPVEKTALSGYNLIGNPYPSAIDADLFLSNANNNGLLSGTIYFWTHNTAISAANAGTETFNYSSNDYAKYNLTGGTKGLSAKSGGVAPNGKIGYGQAFFVEAVGTVGVKNLVVNNSMRVKAASDNSQFYRNANTAKENTIEKNRIWLSVTNKEGAYDEMLLGYITGATNDFDNGYDGKTFSAGNNVMIYSILADRRLSIQGRDLAFNDEEKIPVGYRAKIAGTLSIGIENFDGFFDKQDVFLVDKTNNTVTNLKTGSYTFTTEAGTYDNRFELKYRDATLGTDSPVLSSNEMNVFANQNQLYIKSKSDNIKSVMVYDLLGKMVYQKNDINNQDFSTNEINAKNQIVIVKVKSENDAIIVKKVILN